MQRPLQGIRVLDLTIWQQGTYASAVLADLGADVIKVEEIESGDPGRHFGVAREIGLSGYFEAHNRGKRSIALNLKHPAGRDVFMRLAQDADAFLNNYRIPAIERLGLDYESVSAVNPRIVYVHASGFGHAGDDRDGGAFDLLAQARGGIMSRTGEPDDPPLPAGSPIADQVGALHACIALLTGIVGRNATGRGMKLDTSLLGSQISLQAFDITNYLFTGHVPQRSERGGTRPFWRVYRGSDDRWFVIGMLLDRAWKDVCEVIGRPDLCDDERFDTFLKRVTSGTQELIAVMDDAFAKAPAHEWIARLNAVGMFSAPVQDYADIAGDPQVQANAYVHDVPHPGHEPVRMAGTGIAIDGEPVRIERLAPGHGEHTEEVLLQAGYSWDEIATLREAGVIGPKRHTPT
jgi:crotonobetainyl-CoA:carnitine CoA-transferase CaiB-like acyl-CoA transferase